MSGAHTTVTENSTSAGVQIIADGTIIGFVGGLTDVGRVNTTTVAQSTMNDIATIG